MTDFHYSKKLDLTHFDQYGELKIIRYTKDGCKRLERKYVPLTNSLLRLEAVVNNCGEHEVELTAGCVELEFYFRHNIKLSDFSRKQLLDRAVADRHSMEYRQAELDKRKVAK